MPKAIDVYPKDVYLTLEFPLSELVALKLMLDKASIEYESDRDPEMVEAARLLNDSIYPFLDHLCTEQMPHETKTAINEFVEKAKK